MNNHTTSPENSKKNDVGQLYLYIKYKCKSLRSMRAMLLILIRQRET